MDEGFCSIGVALERLDEIAHGAPLLALGQTALWDEPMKACVVLELERLGSKRAFVAGVHDTDYFAKLPTGPLQPGKFRAMPHNATTTRDLWSAAGEFSALFGSETVITRHDFLSAGLNVQKVQRSRPGALDEASEAFGWRGIVALDENPPIVAEMDLEPLLPTLRSTLQWAADNTVACIASVDRGRARAQAERLMETFDEEAANARTLSNLYRALLPKMYAFASGSNVERLQVTATTELLRLNVETCDLPRFQIVELFLNPETRDCALDAYNRAVEGTEVYTLDRFGTGAVPFDVFVPGHGRGTLRIGSRGLVIMAREPLFVSLRRPLRTVRDLATAIEEKFGENCVLIGKAVTLISQLAREMVFVFHEEASGYVKHTRKFHDLLAEKGICPKFHPILRIRYETWDALAACEVWLDLPGPLRRTFGADELCSRSFASRWREVKNEQAALLAELGRLRRPIDLIRFLDQRVGASWSTLADEYSALHDRLEQVAAKVNLLRSRRAELYEELRRLKARRQEAEREKGEHFRREIFGREPSPSSLERREALTRTVREIGEQIDSLKRQIRDLVQEQEEIVSSSEVRQAHERRRSIELEAEIKRMGLIRDAVIASKGLVKAARRPSAWWFPLVSPKGTWFQSAAAGAAAFFEELVPAQTSPSLFSE